MQETVAETIDCLQIQPVTFLELLAASGQIDAKLHRLLSLTLDKRVNNQGWDYQIT